MSRCSISLPPAPQDKGGREGGKLWMDWVYLELTCFQFCHQGEWGKSEIIVSYWKYRLSHICMLEFYGQKFFFFFKGRTCSIWRFPGQGLNRSYSCQPIPQPQQHRIQATSATYTTVHGNTRSLTHWARPGIEPSTSWFLVGFFSTMPRQELPITLFFKKYKAYLF